jgi:hypothetical protein
MGNVNQLVRENEADCQGRRTSLGNKGNRIEKDRLTLIITNGPDGLSLGKPGKLGKNNQAFKLNMLLTRNHLSLDIENLGNEGVNSGSGEELISPVRESPIPNEITETLKKAHLLNETNSDELQEWLRQFPTEIKCTEMLIRAKPDIRPADIGRITSRGLANVCRDIRTLEKRGKISRTKA